MIFFTIYTAPQTFLPFGNFPLAVIYFLYSTEFFFCFTHRRNVSGYFLSLTTVTLLLVDLLLLSPPLFLQVLLPFKLRLWSFLLYIVAIIIRTKFECIFCCKPQIGLKLWTNMGKKNSLATPLFATHPLSLILINQIVICHPLMRGLTP